MKKILLLCLFLGITQGVFSQKNNTNNLPKLNIKTFEEGKVVFKLKKNGTGYAPLNEKTIRDFALKAPQKRFPKSIQPSAEARSKDGQPLIDLTRIFELEISPNISLDNAVKALLQDPAVEYAEKIRFHHPLYTPNDPGISPASPTEHLNKVRAYQAWDTQKGSAAMTIGIVDFGFTTTHPDMQGNLHPAKYDFGNNDTELTLPHPYGYHGGTVSGLASATPDNAIGVAGVGFDCRYLPIKFVSDDLNTQKPEEAIEYAMNNGAKVINMSWGRQGSSSGGASQYEEDFYNYCVINRDVVLVVAAGNSGIEEDWYPATYKNMVSVGGTATDDNVLSTYGRGLDILAPYNGFYTTYLSAYASSGLNGTSFSSPIVAAGAALVRAQFPTLTAFQVRARLESTADNVILGYTPANVTKYQGKMGYGRLNIERALIDVNVKNVRSSNHQTQNNGYILAGASTTITADFKNYLSPTTALQATLTCFDSNITIIDGNSVLGAMATNTSQSNALDNFSIQISATAPTNLVCVFKIAYTDGAYTDFDYFTLLVNPDYYLVNSNRISVPINKKGGFEYNYPFAKSLDCPEKQFTPLANNLGFVVATSATKVSNTIPKYDGTKDADFVNQSNFIETNSASYQEVKVGFNDNNASVNDIGVEIKQKSYAFKSSPNDKFIISEYLVKNTNITALNDVYVGLFTDFDMKLGTLDKADYDATNKMSYVFAASAPNAYAGVKILTTQTANSFAIDGNTATGGSINLYDGFTKAEKFQALTGTRLQAGGTLGNDVSVMLSTKINTLNSNASQMVAFALLFGDNLADLQAQAVLAQTQFNAQNTTADAVIAPNFNVCTGGSITLTPTPPTVPNPALIYDFYTSLPLTTPVFTGLSYPLTNQTTNQTYYVVARDNNLFAGAPKILTITILNCTTANPVIASNFDVCAGGNVTLTPTPPTVPNPTLIYDFYLGLPSPTNLPVSSGLSLILTSQTVNNTYYIVARDTNPVASAPKMVTITILNCTTANPVIASNFDVCAGGSVTLTPTPPIVPNPALIYDFYLGLPSPTNLPVSSGLSLVLTNQIANNTYYIVARDTNPVQSAPKMVTITLLPASNATFTQSTQEVILSNSSVTFTDTTPNANVSSWRISDGRVLTGRTITVNFSFSSTFTVILTSTNTLGCISKVVFGTVVVRDAVTSLNNNFSSAIKIYPNPAQEYIFIENLTINTQIYTIIDVLGREVLKGNFTPNNSANNQQEINIKNLAKGIYYLQSIDNKVIVNKVFVKN